MWAGDDHPLLLLIFLSVREKKRHLVFLSFRNRESTPRRKKGVKSREAAARESRWDVSRGNQRPSATCLAEKGSGQAGSFYIRTGREIPGPFCRQYCRVWAASAKHRRDAHEEGEDRWGCDRGGGTDREMRSRSKKGNF
jgi:hypothetical protein